MHSSAHLFTHPSRLTAAARTPVRQLVALCAMALIAAAAQAADPAVLAKGTVKEVGPVQITSADVAADVQRIPLEVRPQVLTKEATMNTLVTNLYTRRALAQRAQVEGLDKQPEVAAAIALARDKVLSDALLVDIDKGNTPPDAKALTMARTLYQAKPDEFNQPEQAHVRHILIAVKDPSEDAAAKAKAEDLLKQVRAGGDFAELAKTHSADPGSAAKGGDLGFFGKGRMVPEFDNAAFQLKKPGEVADLIKTQFGYHVLQLVEMKPAGRQSFDEVKDALVAKVRQTEQQKGRETLARQLEATVKLDEPAIKSTVDKLVAPAPVAAGPTAAAAPAPAAAKR